MTKQVKLSTFIRKGITAHQRQSPAFGALLTFLPHMYAAQMRPQRSTRPSSEATLREEYLYANFERYQGMRRSFQNATRIELRIFPPMSIWTLPDESGEWVCFEVAFFQGKEEGFTLSFCFHLVTGIIGTFYKPG